LRSSSNEEEVDGPGTGVEPEDVPSRLENFSNALIRLEMPEETLIFLAMSTGVGGPLSMYELDTDRPTAKACMADGEAM
jgi:hypothetical protein